MLTLASVAGLGAASTCSVELIVDPKVKTVDITNSGVLNTDHFDVRIRNAGLDTIELVEPGDGSGDGWRTPIMKWQVELVGGVYEAPKVLPCGNTNPLRSDEVFVLNPGDSHAFSTYVPGIWVTQAGTYRLRLEYENDPFLEWSGGSHGVQDPEAMRRVRRSTACMAVSNEIIVEVTGTPPYWLRPKGPALTLSTWGGPMSVRFDLKLAFSGDLMVVRHDPPREPSDAPVVRQYKQILPPSAVTQLVELARAADDFASGCMTAADGTNASLEITSPEGTSEQRCMNASHWPQGERTAALLAALNSFLPEIYRVY